MLVEFRGRGFALVRVEDVTCRVNVANGTSNLRFKDKETLFEKFDVCKAWQAVPRLEVARLLPGQSMPETVEAILRPLVERL